METCKLFAELVKATLDLEQKYLMLETKLKEQELLIEQYESKIQSLVGEKIGEIIDEHVDDLRDEIRELSDKVEELDQYVDDAKDEIKSLEEKVENFDEENIAANVMSEIASRLR